MTDAGDRIPYDTGALEDSLAVLTVTLYRWQARDDTKPQAYVRRAASTAVDEIDVMLLALHDIRARLVSEIRVSDETADTRAAAMLDNPRTP